MIKILKISLFLFSLILIEVCILAAILYDDTWYAFASIFAFSACVYSIYSIMDEIGAKSVNTVKIVMLDNQADDPLFDRIRHRL